MVRVAWLIVAAVPGALGAFNGTSISPWLIWATWAIIAVAVLVLHPLSLVTIRCLAPLLVAQCGWRIIADSQVQEQVGPIAGFFVMLLVTASSFSAVYGAAHVQAAAYGHEQRHLLRPPISVILPIAILWLLVAVAGAVAVNAETFPIATVGVAVFVALSAFALRRAVVLARRWLVFVPAGIAIHDPLMLRDTFMVRSHNVRGLRPAAADTTAFDATGTTWGVALELVLSHPHDVSLAEFGVRISRTVDRLHVTAVLLAPSRPSAVLASNAASEHHTI